MGRRTYLGKIKDFFKVRKMIIYVNVSGWSGNDDRNFIISGVQGKIEKMFSSLKYTFEYIESDKNDIEILNSYGDPIDKSELNFIKNKTKNIFS